MADVATPLATRSRIAPPARALFRALGLAAATARILVEERVAKAGIAPAFADRAQRTARTILSVHGVDLRVAGPLPQRPSVLVANHLGYLDPLIVAAAVPCLAIAKGETQQWLLIGAGLEGLGVLFLRRGDTHSGAVVLRKACRALGQGAHVLNFPEGTTTNGSALGPFRRGIFGLRRLAGAEIVPLRIAYDDDRVPWYGGQTFMPHYWHLAGVPKVVARVRFGAPLSSTPEEKAVDLARRARDAVAALPTA